MQANKDHDGYGNKQVAGEQVGSDGVAENCRPGDGGVYEFGSERARGNDVACQCQRKGQAGCMADGKGTMALMIYPVPSAVRQVLGNLQKPLFVRVFEFRIKKTQPPSHDEEYAGEGEEQVSKATVHKRKDTGSSTL